MPSISHIKRVARGLDSSIRLPGGFRVGIDAFIGLVPFLGDALGAALSTYIVVQGARMGATTPVLARMMFNIVAEAIIGIIPLVGDIFDAIWKANDRNALLLEKSLPSTASADIEPPAQRLTRAAVLMLLAFSLVLIGLLIASVMVVTTVIAKLI
jgi:hypothetical protein